MMLLLDEDSQGNVLVRLLRDAGHDVETAIEAHLMGEADSKILAYANQTGRTLLTRNVKDFLALNEANNNHPGILIEHQDANPAKNMNYVEIVVAIGKIEASKWDLRGEIIAINFWQ